MDHLPFMLMIIALSPLLVGAGVGLVYSGKRNSALAGAGLIAVSTIPLFAFIDLKEIEKNLFVVAIIACLWVFAILVVFKTTKKDEIYWR